MRTRVLALLCAAACGRVGFDAQPTGDAAAAGDTTAPGDGVAADAPTCAFGAWDAPVRHSELSSSDTDWGPTQSRDGLELMYASDRSGTFRLYDAMRPTPDDAWSAPTVVEEIATGEDPSLSADALELYWSGTGGVHHAVRATRGQPWTGSALALDSTAAYEAPGGPDISRDGLTILFTATATGDGQIYEWVAGRSGVTHVFSNGVQLSALGPAQFGSLGNDGLAIVFQSSDLSEIDVATRPSLTAPFGAAAPLSDLSGSGWQLGDADLSDDGTTLWFARNVNDGAGFDLYSTTRPCN